MNRGWSLEIASDLINYFKRFFLTFLGKSAEDDENGCKSIINIRRLDIFSLLPFVKFFIHFTMKIMKKPGFFVQWKSLGITFTVALSVTISIYQNPIMKLEMSAKLERIN